MALEGRTVIYKNQHGVRLIGVLSGLSGQQDWAADLRLTITETDWREYDGGRAV